MADVTYIPDNMGQGNNLLPWLLAGNNGFGGLGGFNSIVDIFGLAIVAQMFGWGNGGWGGGFGNNGAGMAGRGKYAGGRWLALVFPEHHVRFPLKEVRVDFRVDGSQPFAEICGHSFQSIQHCGKR